MWTKTRNSQLSPEYAAVFEAAEVAHGLSADIEATDWNLAIVAVISG